MDRANRAAGAHGASVPIAVAYGNPATAPVTTATIVAPAAPVAPVMPVIAPAAPVPPSTPAASVVPATALAEPVPAPPQPAPSHVERELGQLRTEMGDQFALTKRAIEDVADRAYYGIAAAMAMPNFTPSQPGKTLVSAGVGSYQGRSAIGAGATYRSRSGEILLHGGVALTGRGDVGMRMHVGVEF